MESAFLIIITSIFMLLFLNVIVLNIWSLFDHSSWSEDAQPSTNAQIVDIQIKKVKYAKNAAKFKTTVIFSDGFRFITHRTKRKQHYMSYEISIDKNEILMRAISAHEQALEKRMN